MRFRSGRFVGPGSQDLTPRLYVLKAGILSLAVLATISFCTIDVTAQQNQGSPGMPALHDGASWPPISPLVNRQPDANRILDDFMKLQDNEKRITQWNMARQKMMVADTTKLLTLARELNAATGKSNNRPPSVDEVRKAEEIEKLAHNVREKMRASVSE